MTEFECGCRIVNDMINLNRSAYKKPSWAHLLKTFVNVCGNCGKKQIKILTYRKQTYGNGKATNEMVYELSR